MSTIKEMALKALKLTEAKTELIAEARRLVSTHHSDDGKRVAKVYKDHDWDEHQVEFHSDGKHHEGATYHTSGDSYGKSEAVHNAGQFIKHGIGMGFVKEDTVDDFKKSGGTVKNLPYVPPKKGDGKQAATAFASKFVAHGTGKGSKGKKAISSSFELPTFKDFLVMSETVTK